MAEQDYPQSVMVAVLNAAKRPVGLGLVLESNRVVTCAHVVEEALGARDGQVPPGVEITLKSVLTRTQVSARVRSGSWHAVDPDFKDPFQDLCLLEILSAGNDSLETLPGLAWDKLEQSRSEADAELKIYGYPGGEMPGIVSKGYRLGEPCDGGWLALVEPSPRPSGYHPVERGYSGSLAWDVAGGQAVGLVVASRCGGATAYVIPCATLVRAFKSPPSLSTTHASAGRTRDNLHTLTVCLRPTVDEGTIQVSYHRRQYGKLAMGRSFSDPAKLIELRRAVAATFDQWRSEASDPWRMLLFDLLFPTGAWDELSRGLFGQNEAPARYPIRVRVCTEHPKLASLPWLFASSAAGGRLADAGWVFEVVAEETPAATVRFPKPCRILVAAPCDPNSEAHVNDLRQELAGLSPIRASAEYFRRVVSKQGLFEELVTFRPHLLYLYGSAEGATKSDVGWCLEGGKLLLEELAAQVSRGSTRPDLVYVNPLLAHTERLALSPRSIYPQVPALLYNLGGLEHRDAELLFQRWLRHCLAAGLDPALALSRTGQEAAAVAVRTSYDRWQSDPEPTTKVKPRGTLELDRQNQRSVVAGIVRELVTSRRVEAIIAYAERGNHLELFSEQALGYLKETGDVLAAPCDLEFPDVAKRQCSHFDDELKARLEKRSNESLQQALRRHAAIKRGNRMPVLWLHWRNPKTHRLAPEDVGSWLEHCSNLARECSEDMRIVCYLAREVDGDQHRWFREVVSIHGERLADNNEKFSYSLLDPLGHVPEKELLNFLRRKTTCPDPVVAKKLILNATKGQYEQTYALILRAEQDGWPRILRDLTPAEGSTVPPEITF